MVHPVVEVVTVARRNEIMCSEIVDWANADSDEIVCWCIQVDKETIVNAIRAGATTVDQIREMTDARTGNQCKIANPSEKSCASDIMELMRIYG